MRASWSAFCFALVASSATASPTLQVFTVNGSQRRVASAKYLGDVTVVQAAGLTPNTEYTLNNSLNYGKVTYQASVTMQSDANGAIDTGVTSASGSYTGVDPDGLFWSMATDSLPMRHHPFAPAPISTSYNISLMQNGSQVAAATLAIGETMPGVTTVSLNGTGLVGTLYLPNARGPRPAVIAFGGSEGGADIGQMYAAALANQGYVALGLAYFGAKGVPQTLTDIPLEYFQKAIQYLQSRPEVQAGQIAVMGASRGGELSLLLGSTFPQIKAVVALVPSSYLWSADDRTAGTSHPNAAWTYQGKALPFLNATSNVQPCATTADGHQAYCLRPVFEQAVAASSAATLDQASIKVEQTNGPILLLGGQADEEWQSCVFSDTVLARLKANHHAFADEEMCFPNAGHLGMGPPGSPTTTDAIYYDPPYYDDLGGTAAGDAASQRASWTKILQFLNVNLPFVF